MPPSSDNNSKKRKTEEGASEHTEFHTAIGYAPLTLDGIRERLEELCRKIPPIPDDKFELRDGKSNPLISETLPQSSHDCPYDKKQLKLWAATMQACLEEFHLLVACVSPATYVWGTDRSGAAEQNLGLLSNEFLRSQEQLLARVSPRLNDVVAPVVTMLTDKTITTKEGDKEIKQNYYITTLEDPDYVDLCYTILARNSPSLRHVVLANFDKLLRTIEDYLQAQDTQHDTRGFVY